MNLSNQEKISVNGHTAIYHAWELVPEERRVDFSQHVSLITKLMSDLVVSNKPKFIVIEGESGCGASGLASVLSEDGVNVKLLNVVSLCNGPEPADVTHHITDTNITYIFDGLGFAAPEVSDAITAHVNSGGIILAFMQCKRDMTFSVEPTWLKLDRTSLKLV